MSEESLMILTLLRDGKVSAAEAERLLRAVREAAPSAAPGPLEQAAALAGRALEFLPKSKLDSARVGAAWRTARDVAAEVGRFTRSPGPAAKPEAGRPAPPPAPQTAQAQAAETAQSVVTWSGVERLVLVNPYGNVRVAGRSGPAGAAQATLTKAAWAETEAAARVMLQQVFLVSRVEDGACRVEIVAPPDAAGRVTVDYEVAVPPTVALEVQTTFGAISARDTHCGRELTLTSRGGDITAAGGSAGTQIRVQSQSGNVHLSHLRAERVSVEATSGGVTLRESSGALTLKTTSGAIAADALNTPAVSLSTTTGDARLSFAAPFSGSVAGATVGGALSVTLWDNSDTRVDLTATGGVLSCALPLSDRAGDGVTHLAGRIGDGTGSVTLQSESGDVGIKAQR